MQRIFLFTIFCLIIFTASAQIDTAYTIPALPTTNDNIGIVIEGRFIDSNDSITDVNVSIQDSSIQIVLICGNGTNTLPSPYYFDTIINIGMLDAQIYYVTFGLINIPYMYSDTFSFEVFNPVSIENENENGLFFYPNPARENLIIETELNGTSFLELLDINGKPVLTSSIFTSKTSIDISSLPVGVYTALLFQNANIMARRKIIVE